MKRQRVYFSNSKGRELVVKNIISRMSEQYDRHFNEEQDLNKADYGDEIGIIITATESKVLVDYIKDIENR